MINGEEIEENLLYDRLLACRSLHLGCLLCEDNGDRLTACRTENEKWNDFTQAVRAVASIVSSSAAVGTTLAGQ